MPSISKATKSIFALLRFYKWNSLSVVRQEKAEWEEVSRTLGSAAKINDIKVLYTVSEIATSSEEKFKRPFYYTDAVTIAANDGLWF